ncbi:MAG: hypothetical protein COA81_12520 [Alphaproteobacteria bacterium]|nr:MAG: hypothetical protein COA81_12520 [Alphaproteobacteria bacterium]
MTETKFKMDSWDEEVYFKADDNSKISKATVTKSYSGEIDGKGVLNYLMSYYADGSAYFVGIERVEGEVSGKTGTFIFSHEGTFKDGIATSEFQIVKGSATGNLIGLTGKGHFSSGHAMTVPIKFSHKFE